MQILHLFHSLRSSARRAVRSMTTGSAAGMSLIEASIALAATAIIGGSVATVGAGILDTTRVVAARDDVAEISAAVYRLAADQGGLALTTTDGSRLEMMVGVGQIPQAASGAAVLTRQSDGRLVVSLTDVLYDNSVGLPLPAAARMLGWRGPYVQPDAGSDPWGNRYAVVLGTETSPAAYVLSAGPDGVIESEPNAVALRLVGDDVVHVLGGSRR